LIKPTSALQQLRKPVWLGL